MRLLAWFFVAWSMAGGAVTFTEHGPFKAYAECLAALRAERQKPLTAAYQCVEDDLS